MSDDNKQTVDTNTNDDLNINFDIILDKNEQSPKVEEDLKIDIENKSQINSDLNFDLTPSPQIEEEISNKQDNNIVEDKEPETTVMPEIISEKIETIAIDNTEKIETKKETDNQIIENTENSYNPDLNAANQTIQQLQEAKQQWQQEISSDKLDNIQTTQTIDAKITKQETETVNTINVWVMNLDDIISPPEIKTQSPIQDTPQIQFPESVKKSENPYDILETTTQVKNTWEHKKHLIMIIAIVLVCLIVGFFVLKTMYPVQFGTTNEWSWNNIESNTPVTEPFQETTPPVEEPILSWETITNTWTTDQNINISTWDMGNISWDMGDHNANPSDPFEALDDLQTTDEQKKQTTIDSLKDFVSKWQYYLDLWKQNKISDMMKYWTLLKGKSNTFITQIENWEILDISSLDWYLAQASWYLQNLQELENASNTTAQEPNPQKENSGFNQTWEQETAPDWSTWENTQL